MLEVDGVSGGGTVISVVSDGNDDTGSNVSGIMVVVMDGRDVSGGRSDVSGKGISDGGNTRSFNDSGSSGIGGSVKDLTISCGCDDGMCI